jgi:signal transduction histidine kinase
MLNITDLNGVTPVRNFRELAKRGGGFSYHIRPNPAHSDKEEFKLHYVLKLDYVMTVDDEWFLGSGIYWPEV